MIGVGFILAWQLMTTGQPKINSSEACWLGVGLVVVLLALSVCVLATSFVAGGLGVAGIAAGHGRGRRLGIYAVVLAVLALVPIAVLAFMIG